MKDWLRKISLSATQTQIMRILEECGETLQTLQVTLRDVDQATLLSEIASLEKLGYVEWINFRGQRSLNLTAKGRAGFQS